MPTSTLIGTVSAVSGTSVTVLMPDGTTQSMQRLRHVTCAAGDGVEVTRSSGAQWVSGAFGAGAAPAPEPGGDSSGDGGTGTSPSPSKPGQSGSGDRPVSPVYAGTYRGRWLTDRTDLMQGDAGYGRCFGAAYFGATIMSLPGTLSRIVIPMTRADGGVFAAQTPTMHLLSGRSRPAGSPTSLASAPGPAIAVGKSAQWPVPDVWLARLDSGEAGGIGIYVAASTPYMRISSEGASFTALCYWTGA